MVSAKGIGGSVTFDGKMIQILRTGLLVNGRTDQSIPISEVTMVHYKPASLLGGGYFKVCRKGDSHQAPTAWSCTEDPTCIIFNFTSTKDFDALNSAIKASMSKQFRVENKDVLGISELSSKNEGILQSNIIDGETIVGVMTGINDQAIVALEERLLILKSGFLAGATGGGRVTSFYYRDITSIEVNTGWVNAVIEVVTAGHGGEVQKDFWDFGNDNDPFKASNCLPLLKSQVAVYEPQLKELRTRIARAKKRQSAPSAPTDLSSELTKLAGLLKDGILTEEEFAQAKQKLLGG